MTVTAMGIFRDPSSLLERQSYFGCVSIKDPRFGARMDGTSDDSAAIQSAIDYMHSIGGGDVFVPPGTARVQNITLKDNVRLCGAGHASILKLVDGAANWTHVTRMGESFSFTANNVEISDIKLDGNQATIGLTQQQMHAIAISTGSNNVRIRNVWCTNTCGDGIWMTPDGGSTKPNYVGIYDSYFDLNSRQSISYLCGTNVVIMGNRCTGNIDLEPVNAGDISQATVTGNVCNNLNVTNVGYKRSLFTISDNFAQASQVWSIGGVSYVGNTVFGLFSLSEVQDVTVSGCSLKAVSISPPNGQTNSRITFVGNTIINENNGASDPQLNPNSKGATVYIWLTSKMIFKGNVIISPSMDGIMVDTGTCSDITLEGNEIYDTVGTSTTNHGIYIVSTSSMSGIEIGRNKINGFAQGIYANGASSVASGRISGNTVQASSNNINVTYWNGLVCEENILIGNVISQFVDCSVTVKNNDFQTTANVHQLLTLSGCSYARVEMNQFANDGDSQTVLLYNCTSYFVFNNFASASCVYASGGTAQAVTTYHT